MPSFPRRSKEQTKRGKNNVINKVDDVVCVFPGQKSPDLPHPPPESYLTKTGNIPKVTQNKETTLENHKKIEHPR